MYINLSNRVVNQNKPNIFLGGKLDENRGNYTSGRGSRRNQKAS